MPTKVDIGIACAPNQSPVWWTQVMNGIVQADRHPEIEIGKILSVATALPDQAKNKVVSHGKRRDELTDANRSRFTHGFLEGDSDWLWQIDDDTVPPRDALLNLLKPQREFIAGVYFLGGWPHNPVMYRRDESGLYEPYINYPHRSLFEVDSVGMGCTLIHRSVFERIQDEHTVFVRPNGSLMPVHNSKVHEPEPNDVTRSEEYVDSSLMFHQPVSEWDDSDMRPWPFYAMEYGRTEDHHFCELADAVGIKPYVDTSVVCDHLKLRPVGRGHHKAAQQKIYSLGARADDTADRPVEAEGS